MARRWQGVRCIDDGSDSGRIGAIDCLASHASDPTMAPTSSLERSSDIVSGSACAQKLNREGIDVVAAPCGPSGMFGPQRWILCRWCRDPPLCYPLDYVSRCRNCGNCTGCLRCFLDHVMRRRHSAFVAWRVCSSSSVGSKLLHVVLCVLAVS